MRGRIRVSGLAALVMVLTADAAFAQTRIIVGTSNSMPGCQGMFNSQTREPVFVDGLRLAVNDKCGPNALRASLKGGKVIIPSAKKTCSEAAVLSGAC